MSRFVDSVGRDERVSERGVGRRLNVGEIRLVRIVESVAGKSLCFPMLPSVGNDLGPQAVAKRKVDDVLCGAELLSLDRETLGVLRAFLGRRAPRPG